MAKVTGIGGVFLKAKDAKGLHKWYHENLGVPFEYGFTTFEGPEAQGTTAFQFFSEGAAAERAVINFRVDDLEGVLERLTAAGAWIDPKRDEASYGKFAWFRDPEGNKVELWEPADEASE